MRELKFRIIMRVANDRCGTSLQTVYCHMDYTLLMAPFTLNDWATEDDYLVQEILAIDQYTGINDKDGTEIYENDIVAWTWCQHALHGLVRYNIDHFEVHCETPVLTTELLSDITPCSVIGNITRNPELMKYCGEEEK